jgi:hypothetical protein
MQIGAILSWRTKTTAFYRKVIPRLAKVAPVS